jgi:NADH-quinone oxidoreductase subunit H
MSDLNALIIEASIKGLVIVGIVQTLAAFEVWLERKVSAWIQNRIGPNRVGPMGLLQPFADVVKLFMKEDLVPDAAHKGFHRLAPALSLAIATMVYAVIPYAHYWDVDLTSIGLDFQRRIYFGIAPNVNIGVLFMLAMTSIGVYGITLAGWSSNSKYSLLGGLRSAAQMISYELAMGISVLAVVLWASSLSINGIIIEQEGWAWNWYIFRNPIAFFIFLICAFAETNRAPFDLPEAEPELVGGFNTEYTGMKFGMFFLAEYANMATASAFIIILFLGGWQLPFPAEMIGLAEGSLWLTLAQIASFALKLLVLLFFFVQVRWSIPRFRYDQLMNLGWKVLLPLSIVNLLVTAFIIFAVDA